MFRITDKKGFHITFKNGYTVSVQFGPGNYCDNYRMMIGDDEEDAGKKGSSNAECAVWFGDGGLINHKYFDGDSVGGQMTPKQVLKLLNWAARQKAKEQTP